MNCFLNMIRNKDFGKDFLEALTERIENSRLYLKDLMDICKKLSIDIEVYNINGDVLF